MLDQRELAQRVKALNGSVAKNDPSSEIILQIEFLKKEVNPTEEMLRTTKAGLIMGKLRQNPNKEIARIASEVVSMWRKGVEAEKAARAQKVKASASPAPAASPLPKQNTSAKRRFEGDPETRKYTDDGVDINRTGINDRDRCIGVLYNGLAYRSTESAEYVLQRAMEVEDAAQKYFKGTTKEYKEKVRSLFLNLKNKTNPDLGRNVISGEITAERFVRMTSKELMSAEQRKLDQELEKENMKKAQVPMAEKSISDTLQCGNCKQKKVSYSQAQTRSADEPMTTFCECMNCGHRWKFS